MWCCWVLLVAWCVLALWRPMVKGDTTCPSVCTCKWKNGKESVECMDRALIAIPDMDPATQILDMSGNNLQILADEIFLRAGLVNLQRIFLRNCQIGQIFNGSFKGLTNLIELDLSHNLLTAIPSGILKDIPFLRDLILTHNSIKKVEGLAFRDVPALAKLDLSHCGLQMIAPRAFEGVEIHDLKLNGNRLVELRQQTVDTLSKIHSIQLFDNPWICDCRMRSVKIWLTDRNVPISVPPVCGGGPERVKNKTFVELQLDEFACKPEMLPTSRYVEAVTSDNVTVICRANSIPPPAIKWYWNGRPLVNNVPFIAHQRIFIREEGEFQKQSELILTNAQETRRSEFFCVAENRAGSTEANFTVRVTLRAAGIAALGLEQMASLGAALSVLIIFVLIVSAILIVRVRRLPYAESKTPAQVEVVTVVNGSGTANGKATNSPTTSPKLETSSFIEPRNIPNDLNFCNPVQKPPRLNDLSYSSGHYNGGGSVINPGSCFVSPSSGSGNNPDLINDAKALDGEDEYGVETVERPASGEYSRNADSLYPSGLWEHEDGQNYFRSSSSSATNPAFTYDDKVPIIAAGNGSQDQLDYPCDYGLPIVEPRKVETAIATTSKQVTLPTNAKTLRVWQKGAVPVLPPVSALKRALSHSRNSPDEGYQEGCGTDV